MTLSRAYRSLPGRARELLDAHGAVVAAGGFRGRAWLRLAPVEALVAASLDPKRRDVVRDLARRAAFRRGGKWMFVRTVEAMR